MPILNKEIFLAKYILDSTYHPVYICGVAVIHHTTDYLLFIHCFNLPHLFTHFFDYLRWPKILILPDFL